MTFRTIPHEDWSTVDQRVWEHPGVVVDLGCLGWNWSSPFIRMKRVIGADPFATPISGADLFIGVVGTHLCPMSMSVNGESSTVISPKGKQQWVQMIPWLKFKLLFDISSISILKVNIEGSEYWLLESMPDSEFSSIDQIAISFHDFVNPEWKPATEKAKNRLTSLGYKCEPINIPYRWFLFTKT